MGGKPCFYTSYIFLCDLTRDILALDDFFPFIVLELE
jgi:hypothetical protein